ncbi:MAG: DUF421 domain-containing protein [Eubacterium sp.]|nr:DUF421 domain-containing protein [Eubacterium sp.]
MEFVYIIVLSLVSVAILFILTKLIGFRQISEMSFFDYVVGISIGSIAAEMATNIDIEWWKGTTAMVIYAVVGILFSVLSQKSTKMRKMISGKPIILIDNGKIIRSNLKKARIEINDLLTSARGNGYFNLSDIDYAIMETTGKISFLPVPLKRQLNPKDFNFAPEKEGLCINVIIDGHIMEEDLPNAKISREELERQIRNQGKRVENIMLATVDLKKQLTLYEK